MPVWKLVAQILEQVVVPEESDGNDGSMKHRYSAPYMVADQIDHHCDHSSIDSYNLGSTMVEDNKA